MWWDCIANELAGSREPRLFLFSFIINSATLIISLDCHHFFFLRLSIIDAHVSWTWAVPVHAFTHVCGNCDMGTPKHSTFSTHTPSTLQIHTHTAELCKGSAGDKTYGSRQNEAALQVNKTVPGKYWRVLIWRCGKSTEKTARAVKQTHRARRAASRSPCKLSTAKLWDYSNHIYLLTLN